VRSAIRRWTPLTWSRIPNIPATTFAPVSPGATPKATMRDETIGLPSMWGPKVDMPM